MVELLAGLSAAAVVAMLSRPSAFRWVGLAVLGAILLIAAIGPVPERGAFAAFGVSMAGGAILTARWLQAKGVNALLVLLGAAFGFGGGLLLALTLGVNLGLLTP